jgi:hypothetical protein
MAPVTHLFASWIVAATATDNPRDCRWVTLAGVLPDADGLGLVFDLASGALSRGEAVQYQRYHHLLLHGLFAGLAIALFVGCLARRRMRAMVLALAVFHLHLLCDLVGSRGPAPEDLWPIFYFGPWWKEPMWIVKWQWALDAWPNRLISVALFTACLGLAVKQGHSVVGVFNRRADAVVVGILRKWWASAVRSEVIGDWTRRRLRQRRP